MGRKLGSLPPFWGGELGSRPIFLLDGIFYPSSHVATPDMGRKLGALCPFGEGEVGPHLTQCGQGQAHLHAKFHRDPSNRLATIYRPKTLL